MAGANSVSVTRRPTLEPLGREPLVSVLIVNFNYARYLAEAIESVLAQSYQRFEIVICDDGSTDGSPDVISQYAARDGRIRGIVRPNTGMGGALNDAYAASSGEIIAMLDADDAFQPQKLARVVEKLSGGGRVGVLFDPLVKVDSTGREIGRVPQFGGFDRGELRDVLLRSAGQFAAAPNSGISMRREAAARVFPLPAAEFRTEADAYLRAVAALFYAVETLDQPLSLYRVHANNVTASTVVDLKWTEKALSAGKRIHAAIGAVAAREGWTLTPLEESAGYREVSLIRDYLRKAGYRELVGQITMLNRAAAKVTTADKRKGRLKAAIISAATLLPVPLGIKLIEQIYLPGALKRLASRRAAPR